MPTLIFTFAVLLGGDHTSPQPTGPLFARWLPDGQADSLILKTDDPDATVMVWFERRGFVDNGIVRFDASRREVDPDVMRKQVPLAAGHLRGKVELPNVALGAVSDLTGNPNNTESHRQLGKRLVQDIIHPGVSRLLATLRANYGQYWLPELEPWDSRRYTLGAYCRNIRLRWSADGGTTWADFTPDLPVITLRSLLMMIGLSPEYLSQADWAELRQLMLLSYSPSVAAQTLSRAHGFEDRDDIRAAFIEGATALELAIAESVMRNLPASSKVANAFDAFSRLPLPARIIAAVGFLGGLDSSLLEGALRAIDRRNEVVHEGRVPEDNESVRNDLRALFRTAARFIAGPPVRFPSARGGLSISPSGAD